MAEGAPLLREYVGKTCIEGSNPSGSANPSLNARREDGAGEKWARWAGLVANRTFDDGKQLFKFGELAHLQATLREGLIRVAPPRCSPMPR